ncbi:hypothetical protein Aduo_013864 [Ancylostoma duodenale]
MQLLILAILVAVIGAREIKIEDGSSDSSVEVYIIKWAPSPAIRRPPTKRFRPQPPKRDTYIHSPKKSSTSTPKTTSKKTTRSARTTTTTIRRATIITHGWIRYECNIYKVFRNAKNFDDAEKRCRENGAHLVSIHSEQENHFVHSLTTTGHDINNWEHFVYIGLRMDKRTGKWYWTDGSKVDFTKWAKYQPDQPETEHCAQLYQDLGPKLWTNIEGSRWNSIQCGRPMKYFVCKR